MTHKPRKTMRRRGGAEDARFLTFSCHDKKHLLGPAAARDLWAASLACWIGPANIVLHAWVAMSNHVHLLLTPRDDNITVELARLKRGFSSEYAKLHPGIGPVWMRGGGHDRCIWSTQCFGRTVDYIHANPCRSGLVEKPSAWRWSSAIDWEMGQRTEMPRVRGAVGDLLDLRDSTWF